MAWKNPFIEAGQNVGAQYAANTRAMYGGGPKPQVPGVEYAQAQAAQQGDAPTAASTVGVKKRKPKSSFYGGQ